MAEMLVTPERIDAGRTYLESLTTLGFKPTGAMWSVRAGDENSLELSLFSDLVDGVGTLTIYRSLFAAYDAAQTPSDFDPWFVGLYSPRQAFFDCVADFDFDLVERGKGAAFVMAGGREFGDGFSRLRTVEFEVVRIVHPDWVYSVPSRRSATRVDSLRTWRRFERKVGRAA